MSAFTISANAAAFGSVKVRASRRDTALPGEMEELGSFRRESVAFSRDERSARGDRGGSMRGPRRHSTPATHLAVPL